MTMQKTFHKRDVLLWKSWGIFPTAAFESGMVMMLPSGRECKFVPCKSSKFEKSKALKPDTSRGYKEWVSTPNETELTVEIVIQEEGA
jgi:hypothetical protein